MTYKTEHKMLYLYQASWMAILALSKTALTATLGVALETSIAFQNVVLFVCFNAASLFNLHLALCKIHALTCSVGGLRVLYRNLHLQQFHELMSSWINFSQLPSVHQM